MEGSTSKLFGRQTRNKHCKVVWNDIQSSQRANQIFKKPYEKIIRLEILSAHNENRTRTKPIIILI